MKLLGHIVVNNHKILVKVQTDLHGTYVQRRPDPLKAPGPRYRRRVNADGDHLEDIEGIVIQRGLYPAVSSGCSVYVS